MSQIVKLGAKAIAKDMMDCPNIEKANSRMWMAGFFAGLHEAKMITGDELDGLTNGLSEEVGDLIIKMDKVAKY